MIGRLPYYYFLLLAVRVTISPVRLEDCRIITSFYSPMYTAILQYDWKTAVLLLPSTIGS